jgi:hypothetical protein
MFAAIACADGDILIVEALVTGIDSPLGTT